MPIQKNKTKAADIYLSKNLCHLMNKNNIDSKTLHEHTGIAITTINELKRGLRANPNMTTLLDLANYFDIKIDALIHSHLEQDGLHEVKIDRIPLVSLAMTAHMNEKKNTTAEYIVVNGDDEHFPNCFAVKISNNSLAPLFERDTIFVIAPTGIVHDGDIVLVQFGAHLPCFRRIYIEETMVYFEHISIKEKSKIQSYENYIIIGVVIKAIQNLA